MNIVVKRSQNVRARILNNARGKIAKFENINNLAGNNIWLYGIQCYSAAQLATTPEGDTIVSALGVTGLVFTIVNSERKEVHYRVPYADAIKQLNAGLVYVIEPLQINLTNCHIEITDPTNLAVNQVAYFKLMYYWNQSGK